LAAFDMARTGGAKISFDANIRLALWKQTEAVKAVTTAASMSDLFFLSIDDANSLMGSANPAAIFAWSHRLGAKAVFLKQGSHGVSISDGTNCYHLDPVMVKAVDATGAGDCFCGVTLARLNIGDTILNAARYANAAAALSTTVFGAVTSLPNPACVTAILQTC
jgi:2-dehydro-3-deoxygluconokinase